MRCATPTELVDTLVDMVAGERIAELEAEVERLEDIEKRYYLLQEVLEMELNERHLNVVTERYKEEMIKAKTKGESDGRS